MRSKTGCLNRHKLMPITMRVCWRCRWTVLLTVLFFVTQVDCSALELSVGEVKELVSDLRNCEQMLSPFEIEAELWQERKSGPAGKWEHTGARSEATAWFDGVPKGKMRVDVQKQVSQISGDTSTAMEARYSLVFDGRKGTLINHAFGRENAARDRKSYKSFARRSPAFKSAHVQHLTGARFSTFFFFDSDDQFATFSAMLDKALATPGPVPFRYYREEFMGVECLKITTGNINGNRVTYWLDLSHGFALRGYELVNAGADGHEWIVSSIRVLELKEIAKGVWYPLAAFDETSPRKPGLPFQRSVFRAKNIVASATAFDATVFDTTPPRDYKPQ